MPGPGGSSTLTPLIKVLAFFVVAVQFVAPAPDYRALVDGYRRNGTPQVMELLSLPPDAVKTAVNRATRDDAGWTWEETRAAAILHTEATVQLLRSGNKSPAGMHLDAAQRLLDKTMKLEARQEDFAWRWYTLMPDLLKALDGGALSPALRQYALERWPPTTGRTLLLKGIELESKGNVEGRVPRPGETALIRGTDNLQTTWFAAASDAYGAALRTNATLHQARLHLGRIRMIQGQRTEAASLLRDALASPDPTVAYLSALFLGSIEERDNRFDSAEELYRRANATWPHGQAGPLALAELLSRTGRDSEAREVLVARLTSGTRRIEPMWSYACRSRRRTGDSLRHAAR